MSSKHLMADANFAWPSAEIAVMGAKGAVEIIFKKQLENGKDLDTLVAAYEEKFANPMMAAERGFIDDIVNPQETRKRLCRGLTILKTKKGHRIPKKHDTLPL